MWSNVVFFLFLCATAVLAGHHGNSSKNLNKRQTVSKNKQVENPKMATLNVEDFGKLNNETVKKFTWKASTGVSVSVISYGAIVQSVKFPDKHGQVSDVVLGFDDLDSYVNRNTPYFGATVGRVANRIGGATFVLDDVRYNLAKNAGNNTLHGGIVGFNKVIWNYTVKGTAVTFSYLSKDLEEGFPGNLVTSVTYDVTDDGTLLMSYQAATDKKTIINLTNHAYFNLAGQETGVQELVNHVVAINADKITETDADSIPTGKILDVGGTPYDLRIARRVEDALKGVPAGFDNNYIVSTYGNTGINFISRVSHPSSGRSLEVYANSPGVQFYTANNLPAPDQPAIVGKGGVGYRKQGAFCLETQGFPDAVNHPNFPSVVLSPGEVYDHKVQYRFTVDKSVAPNVVSA